VEGQVHVHAVTATVSGWIVSPWFDVLFVANLGWVLLLIPGLSDSDGRLPITFLQIYFLTTPHRWLTFFLVLADPDRRDGRAGLFILIGLGIGLAVLAVRSATGTFLCLLAIDYVWNSWHFASQHAGVLRMYTRKVGGGMAALERHGLRLFVVYTILRTAGWSTGWLETAPTWRVVLNGLDFLFLVLPITLLLTSLRPLAPFIPKASYLASVCLLYALLLLALHFDRKDLVLALTTGSSLFHAVEYLAIVTHYAVRRRTIGSDGAFRMMARDWFRVLLVYVLALGLLAASAESKTVPDWWVGLNVAMAFLHYAYDGMIWKLRRTATAQALGVG
jgi:hypothetical protein